MFAIGRTTDMTTIAVMIDPAGTSRSIAQDHPGTKDLGIVCTQRANCMIFPCEPSQACADACSLVQHEKIDRDQKRACLARCAIRHFHGLPAVHVRGSIANSVACLPNNVRLAALLHCCIEVCVRAGIVDAEGSLATNTPRVEALQNVVPVTFASA